MSLRAKIPPPLVFLFFVVVAVGLSRVMPALDVGYRVPVAGLIAVLGLVCAASAIRLFRRTQTTMSPLTPDQASALVVTGIYRVTRNPMYLGLALVLTGLCVYLGVWVGLIVVPAFVAYITRFQIVPEEAALAKLFGGAYADYRARVRRWI